MGGPHTGSWNRRVVGGSRSGGTSGRCSRFAAGATVGGKAVVASGLAPTRLWPVWLTGRLRGTAHFVAGADVAGGGGDCTIGALAGAVGTDVSLAAPAVGRMGGCRR